MSLLFRRLEERAAGQAFDHGSASGASVLGDSLSSALRLIPLYAGVTLIADSVASLPMHAYRSSKGSRVRLDSPPLLADPAPGLPGGVFTWKQQLVASLLLRGNAYGIILGRDNAAVPSNVRWLNPAAVQVDQSGALPKYSYNGRSLDSSEVLHVPGFVLPGSVVGLSPVGLFRTQIETGMRIDRFASSWFDTGVAPSGHLRNTEQTINPDTAAKAKDSFKRAVQDRDFWVSGKDWEWKALTLSAADSQFLESIKATATQIATLLRLAPEDVGGVTGGKSLTYSTLEMNELQFNRRALMPWTSRIEQALSVVLPRGQYAKFNLDARVRTDLKTRMDAHKVALEIGVETLDEARALEDKQPLTADEQVAFVAYQQTIKGATPTGESRGGA